MFLGYFDNEEETKAYLDEDGFFKTGDNGELIGNWK
jgi:long-subunit acyl-CoA synthetase (AMP-forming)